MERSYDVKKLIPIRRGPVRRRLGMAWYSARRYLLWCSGKYRFAKSRERRDVLPCVAGGHATPPPRKLRGVDMGEQENKGKNIPLAGGRPGRPG